MCGQKKPKENYKRFFLFFYLLYKELGAMTSVVIRFDFTVTYTD